MMHRVVHCDGAVCTARVYITIDQRPLIRRSNLIDASRARNDARFNRVRTMREDEDTWIVNDKFKRFDSNNCIKMIHRESSCDWICNCVSQCSCETFPRDIHMILHKHRNEIRFKDAFVIIIWFRIYARVFLLTVRDRRASRFTRSFFSITLRYYH